jgi:bacillolysin
VPKSVKYNQFKTIPQPKAPSAQGSIFAMKKLLFLLALIFSSGSVLAQNKFKTVKRSADVVVENPAKSISEEPPRNVIARPKYLTKTSDSQSYMNLIAKKDGLKITVDENGMPSMIEGIPTNLKKVSIRNGRMNATAAAAYNYLEAVKPLLKLSNPDDELNIIKSETDEIETTHVRMQQTYKGVPVYGGEMILHQKESEEVSLLNGHFYPTPILEDVKPSLSADNVGKMAISDISKTSIVKPMTATEMTILKYEKPQTELIIYHQNDKADAEHLAYHITVRPNFLERWVYVIDAKSGEILDKYNYTCTLDGVAIATARDLNGVSRTINTYQSGTSYNLIDASRGMFGRGNKVVKADDPQRVIWTIDATGSKVSEDLTVRQVSSTNNAWSNATAVSAHYNAGLAYDYYEKKHGRKSLNGGDGTIISIINITDENGKGFDNAFWNGEYMGYGNGGTAFKPLAGGLDVAGHEMTHGVIEKTANLEYKGQSGAINESLADCFGALVEAKTGADLWKLGEDVVIARFFPTGALRDLSNPNNGGRSLNDNGFQPASMNQYYSGSEDNYGVHINSGIPNNAFYRFITTIGNNQAAITKAEKIYYRALERYLTRTSKFLELRRALIQSATDLKASAGVTDTDITALRNAFDAVGITDGNAPTPNPTPTPTPPAPTPKTDIPANTGTQGLLSYDAVAKILYKSSTKGEADPNSFVVLANNIVVQNKPTVPDDGTFAYFVAGDKFIKRVNLTGTPRVENVSSRGEWRNVSVSKDGKKLAALRALGTTSALTDKQIFVFDLVGNQSKAFTLYNPTYTQGVNTGQVQNADALEWDHTSENIVYDAFNVIKSATGESEYWDVGFINVWNGSKSTFGTGEVDKLFTSLDKGENIGNPSFSKTSSNIIAFDYFIDSDDRYYVIGVNTERTDGIDFIYDNNTLGYPEYSTKDDLVLYNYENSKGDLDTYQITMAASKIKSVANSQKYLIGNSSFAVWYTLGTRALPTKQNQTISLTKIPDKTVNDPAFDVVVSASSNLAVTLGITSGPATVLGKKITLTPGTAGRVRVNTFQDGNTNFYAVSRADSFCVNPSKPTISVLKKSDANGEYWEYKSSAATGSVWYREGQVLEDSRGKQIIEVTSGLRFTVQVVTADGCASVPSDIRQDPALTKPPVITPPLSTDPELIANVTISPNPTSDKLDIVTPKNIKIESASISSLSGSQLLEKQGNKSNTMTIDIGNLNQGMYLLQIKTNEGIIGKKVIKE